jgi:predicted enzyme related to lactoylglutathione lyase
MHKSRLGALVIDCRTDDLSREAAFWSAALGTAAESPRAQENERYVRLDAGARGIQVLLQRVDHDSRVHLDIESDDIGAEVRRLEGLGATVVERLAEWVVMQAPSGQRFCVISSLGGDFDSAANRWD